MKNIPSILIQVVFCIIVIFPCYSQSDQTSKDIQILIPSKVKSSSSLDGFDTKFVTDGNSETGWRPKGNLVNEWILFKFPKTVNLGEIRIDLGKATAGTEDNNEIQKFTQLEFSYTGKMSSSIKLENTFYNQVIEIPNGRMLDELKIMIRSAAGISDSGPVFTEIEFVSFEKNPGDAIYSGKWKVYTDSQMLFDKLNKVIERTSSDSFEELAAFNTSNKDLFSSIRKSDKAEIEELIREQLTVSLEESLEEEQAALDMLLLKNDISKIIENINAFEKKYQLIFKLDFGLAIVARLSEFYSQRLVPALIPDLYKTFLSEPSFSKLIELDRYRQATEILLTRPSYTSISQDPIIQKIDDIKPQISLEKFSKVLEKQRDKTLYAIKKSSLGKFEDIVLINQYLTDQKDIDMFVLARNTKAKISLANAQELRDRINAISSYEDFKLFYKSYVSGFLDDPNLNDTRDENFKSLRNYFISKTSQYILKWIKATTSSSESNALKELTLRFPENDMFEAAFNERSKAKNMSYYASVKDFYLNEENAVKDANLKAFEYATMDQWLKSLDGRYGYFDVMGMVVARDIINGEFSQWYINEKIIESLLVEYILVQTRLGSISNPRSVTFTWNREKIVGGQMILFGNPYYTSKTFIEKARFELQIETRFYKYYTSIIGDNRGYNAWYGDISRLRSVSQKLWDIRGTVAYRQFADNLIRFLSGQDPIQKSGNKGYGNVITPYESFPQESRSILFACFEDQAIPFKISRSIYDECRCFEKEIQKEKREIELNPGPFDSKEYTESTAEDHYNTMSNSMNYVRLRKGCN